MAPPFPHNSADCAHSPTKPLWPTNAPLEVVHRLWLKLAAIVLVCLQGSLVNTRVEAQRAPRVQTLFVPPEVENFGNNPIFAGDLDGDGFHDLVVGCPEHRNSKKQHGAVFVFRGGKAGVEPKPFLTWRAKSKGKHFGSVITGVGDLNGDGRADLAIGFPDASPSRPNESAIEIYFTPSLDSSAPGSVARRILSDVAGVEMGFSLSGGRDLTGDGLPDLAVGIPNWEGREWGLGSVRVYSKLHSETDPELVWSYECIVKEARFGEEVCITGDANGDGFSDLAVGAVGVATFNFGDVTPGLVYVFLGSKSGLAKKPTWQFGPPSEMREFGRTLAWADLNGDGRSELVVGAPSPAVAHGLPGTVCAYQFHSTNQPPTLIGQWQPQAKGGKNGFSLSSAGDINGDGSEDIVFAAPYAKIRSDRLGQAYVILGSKTNLSSSPDCIFEPPPNANHMAYGLRGGFDLNGDGLADFVLGSTLIPGPTNAVGRVDIVYGSREVDWQDLRAVAKFEGGFDFSWEVPASSPTELSTATNSPPISISKSAESSAAGLSKTTPTSVAPAANPAQNNSFTSPSTNRVAAVATAVPPPIASVPQPLPNTGNSQAPTIDRQKRRQLALVGGAVGILAGWGIWLLNRHKRPKSIPSNPNAVPSPSRKSDLVNSVHDGVSSRIHLLQRAIESGQSMDREKLKSLVDQLDENVQKILGVASDRPKSPREIAENIRGLVSAHHPKDWTWRCGDLENLPAELWPPHVVQQLELALGEVLVNAFRHSGGNHLELSVRQRAEDIEFQIRDNGQGLPETKTSNGLGLNSIQSRLKQIGGRVRFHSQTGQGLEVTLWAPLHPSPTPHA